MSETDAYLCRESPAVDLMIRPPDGFRAELHNGAEELIGVGQGPALDQHGALVDVERDVLPHVDDGYRNLRT